MLKIGVIGLGNMGTEHAEYLYQNKVEGAVLVAIADRRLDRRNYAKEHFLNSVQIFTEGKDLIESKMCDAVIVAVPHYEHVCLSEMALDLNIHVLCEKPAGVFTKEVRLLNEKADKTNTVFAMMFNQRTNCVYRKMKEILSSKQLGDLKRVNWIITDWYRSMAYYNSGSWRATWAGEGGGVLLNQCPHQLDLLQYLCGMPVRVEAHCHYGKWHDIEVEDDVTAYLEYENGATGVFVTSTGDLPGTNRLEITLTKGTLLCENNELYMIELPVDERTYCVTSPDPYKKPKYEKVKVETDGINEQHIAVTRAFVNNILKGTPLIAKGQEGINGLMLSNAMHLSSFLNKMVTLPIDEDLFLEKLNERRKNSKLKTTVDKTYSTDHSQGGELLESK